MIVIRIGSVDINVCPQGDRIGVVDDVSSGLLIGFGKGYKKQGIIHDIYDSSIEIDPEVIEREKIEYQVDSVRDDSRSGSSYSSSASSTSLPSDDGGDGEGRTSERSLLSDSEETEEGGRYVRLVQKLLSSLIYFILESNQVTFHQLTIAAMDPIVKKNLKVTLTILIFFDRAALWWYIQRIYKR